MENEFTLRMQAANDDYLIDVIRQSEGWKPEAVAAAEKEIQKRGIQVTDLEEAIESTPSSKHLSQTQVLVYGTLLMCGLEFFLESEIFHKLDLQQGEALIVYYVFPLLIPLISAYYLHTKKVVYLTAKITFIGALIMFGVSTVVQISLLYYNVTYDPYSNDLNAVVDGNYWWFEIIASAAAFHLALDIILAALAVGITVLFVKKKKIKSTSKGESLDADLLNTSNDD